jgi:hypothetical protein
LTANERWTTYHSVNVGQLGVALIVGISALLASVSHRRPLPWLAQRLLRLYPSYWIVMALCFALTWITGYKQFCWQNDDASVSGGSIPDRMDHFVARRCWAREALDVLDCFLRGLRTYDRVPQSNGACVALSALE